MKHQSSNSSTSYSIDIRMKHSQMLRKKHRQDSTLLHREQIMKKLEHYNHQRNFSNVKLGELIDREDNALADMIPKLLPALEEHWKKGLYQNYFLILLSKPLASDKLTQENLSSIAQFVRRRIEPNYSDKDFIKGFSLFIKKMFQKHHMLSSFYQLVKQEFNDRRRQEEDDQILNENKFLPVIQTCLNTIDDPQTHILLIEAIEGMFSWNPEQSYDSFKKSHDVVVRNQRALSMVFDFHISVLNNKESKDTQAELHCLRVYLQSIKSYGQLPKFLDNRQMVSIFRLYLHSKKSLATVLTKIVISLVRFQLTEYCFLGEFIEKEFLPNLFKKDLSVWVKPALKIIDENPASIASYYSHMTQQIIDYLQTAPSPDSRTVKYSLQLLKEIWSYELDNNRHTSFILFEAMKGFNLLENFQMQTNDMEILNEIEKFFEAQSIMRKSVNDHVANLQSKENRRVEGQKDEGIKQIEY